MTQNFEGHKFCELLQIYFIIFGHCCYMALDLDAISQKISQLSKKIAKFTVAQVALDYRPMDSILIHSFPHTSALAFHYFNIHALYYCNNEKCNKYYYTISHPPT